MQQKRIKKLYRSIGEVSRITGLEPHVLRYWESEFEQLQPRKNRAGRRVYTEADLRMVRRVQHLLREDKYTIDGARQVLNREDEASDADQTAREELIALRVFLEDVLEQLATSKEQ